MSLDPSTYDVVRAARTIDAGNGACGVIGSGRANIRRALACVILGMAIAAPVRAQDSLPSGDSILARFRSAAGASAFGAIESMHSVGSVAIPTLGISGTIEIWQGRPNRTLMHVVVPGVGDIRTGFTGTAGWSDDPAEGPRVMSGAEAVQAQDDAHFESHLRPADLIASSRTVERTVLSGHDCYKVLTVWTSGRETTDCYSVETGLLAGSIRAHHTAAGTAEAVIIYEEYRDIGGTRVPTRVTTIVGGVEQVITLDDIRIEQVPDSAFEPPAAVRALLRG